MPLHQPCFGLQRRGNLAASTESVTTGMRASAESRTASIDGAHLASASWRQAESHRPLCLGYAHPVHKTDSHPRCCLQVRIPANSMTSSNPQVLHL